ncbi:MAG: hypothetical protein COW34_00820 [Armatimonadetes bacterium CG17_big_fil_post_rev_8_21_14_2_50_66_6]|nr:MAG: hypothetical protein COW34_00820 [Armatimonadetes bacterium CG17_big_fil_post_rev_8_21_14_2_50_66_6]
MSAGNPAKTKRPAKIPIWDSTSTAAAHRAGDSATIGDDRWWVRKLPRMLTTPASEPAMNANCSAAVQNRAPRQLRSTDSVVANWLRSASPSSRTLCFGHVHMSRASNSSAAA